MTDSNADLVTDSTHILIMDRVLGHDPLPEARPICMPSLILKLSLPKTPAEPLHHFESQSRLSFTLGTKPLQLGFQMAWRCGSLPRTLASTTARASSSPFRSSPALSRPLRPPPLSGTRVQSRRFSFASSRSRSALGTLASY